MMVDRSKVNPGSMLRPGFDFDWVMRRQERSLKITPITVLRSPDRNPILRKMLVLLPGTCYSTACRVCLVRKMGSDDNGLGTQN